MDDDAFNAKFQTRLDTVERQGNEHTHRLANVEASIKGLGVKVDGIGTEIRSVLQSLTKVEAAPKVDLVKLLTVTKDIAILAGLIATLLGFVINSYGASERAVNKYRIDKLEQRVDHNVQSQNKTDKSGGG